jgi:putative membrane protein
MVTKVGRWAGVAVAVLLFATAAVAQERVNGVDQEIVLTMHRLSHNELAMARVAEDKGTDAKVKELAERIIKDHQTEDRDLLAYAERQDMNMDAVGRAPDAMAYGPLSLARLTSAARGAPFDYEFARRVASDHQGMIAAAEQARRLARTYELRQVIGDQIATMWEHLSAAEALVASLPEPPPPVLTPWGEPNGVSRTQTGADEPPPGAVILIGPAVEP